MSFKPNHFFNQNLNISCFYLCRNALILIFRRDKNKAAARYLSRQDYFPLWHHKQENRLLLISAELAGGTYYCLSTEFWHHLRPHQRMRALSQYARCGSVGQLLDLNALTFALFPVNMNMCWLHFQHIKASWETLRGGGVAAAIWTRFVWQLDLMTFSPRASQAQCGPTCITPAAYQTFMCPEISETPLKAEMMTSARFFSILVRGRGGGRAIHTLAVIAQTG